MADLSKGIRDLLIGRPWGDVFPQKANPSPLSVDGRTSALRILKKYLAELTFYRPNAAGQPAIPFRILEKKIHIEWPDNEEDLEFPSVVFLGIAPASYDTIGLTTYVEEKTRDVYAPGTVLQWQSEYKEVFALDIYASKKPERRAILAGLEVALTPTENLYGIRFRIPEYFNEPVCFTIESRELIEDPDAAKNRRRARLKIQMRFNIVALVNYATLTPVAKTNVDVDEDTNVDVDLAPIEPKDTRDHALAPLGTGPDIGGSKC